ncbi:MAG: ABC transporter permease subunit [Acetobacteraceae bacterium]|nr:ABC transporter permease subunit [Acetobacteraceae bacterium]
MRRLAILLPAAWLLATVLAPLVILATIATATPSDGVPPYAPLLDWSGGGLPRVTASADAWQLLVADGYYLRALLFSLRIAAISALGCLLVGYPLALAITRAPAGWRAPLLLLALLPFWTGFLLRINAWIGLLKEDGWVSAALHAAGLLPPGRALLYTDAAMYLGIIHAYLPFAVLPIYARLSRLDPALAEAAADLGATPLRSFLTVTLPLSMPGVWAGLALVFIPAVGEYVIPELLGGPQAQTIGRVIWQEFFANRDWPQASAVALVLVALLVLPAALVQRAR